jgi:hypothetical protein
MEKPVQTVAPPQSPKPLKFGTDKVGTEPALVVGGTGKLGDRPRRMLLGVFFDVTNPKKVGD